MSAIDLKFDKAVVYPTMRPDWEWAFSSLLLWNRLVFIWDPGLALNDPFLEALSEAGLVQFELPNESEKSDAWDGFKRALSSHIKPPASRSVYIHETKMPHQMKEALDVADGDFARLSADHGSAYMTLLADRVSKRLSAPALAARRRERQWAISAIASLPRLQAAQTQGSLFERAAADLESSAENTILEGVLSCFGAKFAQRPRGRGEIDAFVDELLKLRELGSHSDYRMTLEGYLAVVRDEVVDGNVACQEVATELQKAAEKYEREVQRQRAHLGGQIAIHCALISVAFLTSGTVGGAIAAGSVVLPEVWNVLHRKPGAEQLATNPLGHFVHETVRAHQRLSR